MLSRSFLHKSGAPLELAFERVGKRTASEKQGKWDPEKQKKDQEAGGRPRYKVGKGPQDWGEKMPASQTRSDPEVSIESRNSQTLSPPKSWALSILGRLSETLKREPFLGTLLKGSISPRFPLLLSPIPKGGNRWRCCHVWMARLWWLRLGQGIWRIRCGEGFTAASGPSPFGMCGLRIILQSECCWSWI